MRAISRTRAPVLLGVVIVSVLALGSSFAGVAASADEPGAGAYLARIDDETVAAVAVSPSGTDNTLSATGSHTGAVSFTTGATSASSFISGQSLVSSATADLTAIDLFGGVVTADSLHLAAKTTAGADSATVQSATGTITGLRVNGVPRDPSEGTIVVSGLGTLRLLAAAGPSSATTASAEIIGIRLDLSVAAGPWPAGTKLVLGHASARADVPTYRSLTGYVTPSPTPSASPTKTTKPQPTTTATFTPSTPGTTTPVAPPAGATGGNTYTMPAPTTPESSFLSRFPGAVMPVAGRYWYADWWHAPRAGGRLHEGTDIFAAYGSPIVAVQDGVISNVSTTGIGGNNLRLSNDQGDYFYYAHLSSFAATTVQGARVEAGQTIGYVGTSGDAQGTDPHLHFEIHPQGGEAVNPYPYLEAWRAAGSEVGTASDATGSPVSGGFDPAIDPRGKAAGPPPGDPATVAALDRVALGLAALDESLATGSGESPPEPPSSGETVLTVLTGLGAVVLKRLKLAAILL